MKEFTKQKITFSLALLAALFALGPIVQTIGTFGYEFLGIQIKVKFAYYLFMSLLGLTVYFYAVEFITERQIFSAKKIANISYGIAILVAPLYIALFLVVNVVQSAGFLIKIPVVLEIARVILAGLLSLFAVRLIRSFASRLGEKDRRSEVENITSQQMVLLSQAARLFNDKYYTQTVVECFKIIELAIRKALISKSISFRPIITDMLFAAEKHDIISSKSIKDIDKIRRLRNEAVHTEKQISKNNAAYVLRVTKQILSLLESEKMIELGIYRTKDGKEYDCLFFRDTGTAQAIGPLPEPGQVGSRGVAFEVRTESEQEAKQKLAKEIGPGMFV